MMNSIARLFAGAAFVVSVALATDDGGCHANNCARLVTGVNGAPPQSVRLEDCSKYFEATSTPGTSTVIVTTTADTVTVTAPEVTIALTTTTFLPIVTVQATITVTAGQAPVVQRRKKRALTTKAQPTYATACVAPTEYSSACSCWGVRTRTVTLATPTTTSTLTVTPSATVIPTVTVSPTVTLTPTPATSTIFATVTVQPPGACQNPAVGCGAFTSCGTGSCSCRLSSEGVNTCYVIGSCGRTCGSSAECGANEACITGSCCSGSVCLPISDQCPGPLPALRIFQAKVSSLSSFSSGGFSDPLHS